MTDFRRGLFNVLKTLKGNVEVGILTQNRGLALGELKRVVEKENFIDMLLSPDNYSTSDIRVMLEAEADNIKQDEKLMLVIANNPESMDAVVASSGTDGLIAKFAGHPISREVILKSYMAIDKILRNPAAFARWKSNCIYNGIPLYYEGENYQNYSMFRHHVINYSNSGSRPDSYFLPEDNRICVSNGPARYLSGDIVTGFIKPFFLTNATSLELDYQVANYSGTCYGLLTVTSENNKYDNHEADSIVESQWSIYGDDDGSRHIRALDVTSVNQEGYLKFHIWHADYSTSSRGARVYVYRLILK